MLGYVVRRVLYAIPILIGEPDSVLIVEFHGHEDAPLLDAPLVGEEIVDVGAAVSVDAEAPTSPDWRLVGWAPMSANRFTVACCIRTSAAAFRSI